MSINQLWFVRREGRVVGQFPIKEIVRAISAGEIATSDEISPDQENWIPLSRFPGLAAEPPPLQKAAVTLDEEAQQWQEERVKAAERWATPAEPHDFREPRHPLRKWLGTLVEDRRQKTEDRRQKTEDRRQKTEDRKNRTGAGFPLPTFYSPIPLIMKLISSRDNPLFKQLKKLAASVRERKKTQKTLLDGVHLLAAYRERVGIPEMVLIAAAMQEKPEIQALLAQIPENRLAILEDSLFGEISPVESATGIAAIIPIPPPAPVGAANFCVMLEAIRDPGNLGSILRSAAAAGCDQAYLSPDCVDVWSPKVLRAGMGAHFLLALREDADLANVAKDFPGKVLATALDARKNLYDCDLTGSVAFIIGNEGAGVTPSLLEAVSETVLIPMPGGTESLNAGAAAAICLFERVRQVQNRKMVRREPQHHAIPECRDPQAPPSLQVQPILIFGYGNPSRGDDAIAPHLLSRLEALQLAGVELITDFQLQVENALDLEGRELALFVDASVACPAPYTFSRLLPQQDNSYSTHEMSPASVLHVYQKINQIAPPPSYLLAVRGEFFDLGEPLSEAAEENAAAAFELLKKLCDEPRLAAWQSLLSA